MRAPHRAARRVKLGPVARATAPILSCRVKRPLVALEPDHLKLAPTCPRLSFLPLQPPSVLSASCAVRDLVPGIDLKVAGIVRNIEWRGVVEHLRGDGVYGLLRVHAVLVHEFGHAGECGVRARVEERAVEIMDQDVLRTVAIHLPRVRRANADGEQGTCSQLACASMRHALSSSHSSRPQLLRHRTSVYTVHTLSSR
eukprot:2909553-Prymnesium_polylepis.2